MPRPTSLSGSSRVLMAIPNMGWLRTDLALGMVHWLRDYGVTVWAPVGLQPLAYARNECVKHFLETDNDYIWFVDDDVSLPPDSLKLLLDAEKRAISGVYTMIAKDSDGQLKPCWIVAKRTPKGLVPADGEGIESIQACGFGCVLIERSVFEEVPYPWFEDRSVPGVRGDFLFCKKMEDMGIELFAHFAVRGRHLKEVDL